MLKSKDQNIQMKTDMKNLKYIKKFQEKVYLKTMKHYLNNMSNLYLKVQKRNLMIIYKRISKPNLNNK